MRRQPFAVPFLIAAVGLFLAAHAADAWAQARHPHPHARVVVRPAPYYYPYYRSAFFYDPFWWGYPYPYFYPPYGVYAVPGDPTSSMRIEVEPREAKVYVDGYYAGIVDDFDGTFQRLRLPPGPHEVQLWLEGYRSIRQSIDLAPGATYKIKGALTKLEAGEAGEPAPVPVAPPPQEPAPPRAAPAGAYGLLAVRVHPPDAEVRIDGERWAAPAGFPVTVNLAEGTHRVEVRKKGFVSFSTEVEVRRGATETVNVSLPADEGR